MMMMLMMIMVMMMGLAAWMEGLCVLAPLHREGKGREGRPVSQPTNESESLDWLSSWRPVFCAPSRKGPVETNQPPGQPSQQAAPYPQFGWMASWLSG